MDRQGSQVYVKYEEQKQKNKPFVGIRSALKFKYFECISESCPTDYLFTADSTAAKVKVKLIVCFADVIHSFLFILLSVGQCIKIFSGAGYSTFVKLALG